MCLLYSRMKRIQLWWAYIGSAGSYKTLLSLLHQAWLMALQVALSNQAWLNWMFTNSDNILFSPFSNCLRLWCMSLRSEARCKLDIAWSMRWWEACWRTLTVYHWLSINLLDWLRLDGVDQGCRRIKPQILSTLLAFVLRLPCLLILDKFIATFRCKPVFVAAANSDIFEVFLHFLFDMCHATHEQSHLARLCHRSHVWCLAKSRILNQPGIVWWDRWQHEVVVLCESLLHELVSGPVKNFWR